MMIRSAIFAFCLALPATAQVSLEELDTVADEADAGMTAFRSRLNDPDPDRALAVLHTLITKGDAAQQRLAIRHGLESTDRAIRATTLRAIFDSEPTLRVVFDPASDEPSAHFANSIIAAGGVVDADSNGSVTFKVNGYNPEEECWTVGRYKTCLLRIRADLVSLWFVDSWGTYELDGITGRLIGEQSIARNLTAATVDLSE